MTNPLRLTVQEVHDQEVIAKTTDGQIWHIPLAHVHGTPHPGEELRGLFFTPDVNGLKESGIADHMINELLNPPRT